MAGLMVSPKWAQAPKPMPLTQHLVNIKNRPGFLHSMQISITKISQRRTKYQSICTLQLHPLGLDLRGKCLLQWTRDTCGGDEVGTGLETEAGVPTQHLPAVSCESWPSACPLSGLRVPSRNMRAWLNKGHKEPPWTFHHWLSFLDTWSWNLGSLLLPDDWLSSRLRLPSHAAKTTATMGLLKKLNGDQTKYSRQ